VDPALYSKELMAHLEAAVESAEVQVSSAEQHLHRAPGGGGGEGGDEGGAPGGLGEWHQR